MKGDCMVTLEKFERETVIGYSDDGNSASITTFNRTMLNKLEKMNKDYPDTYKFVRDLMLDGEVVGKEYSFPKRLITLRSPSTKKQMSEDQKKAAAERMKKNIHNNKKKK